MSQMSTQRHNFSCCNLKYFIPLFFINFVPLRLHLVHYYFLDFDFNPSWLKAITVSDGCSFEGQFLPVPGDQCSYYVCVVGGVVEPWANGNNQYSLARQRVPCAPGSGVPSGYTGGSTNPCEARPGACIPRMYYVKPSSLLFYPSMQCFIGMEDYYSHVSMVDIVIVRSTSKVPTMNWSGSPWSILRGIYCNVFVTCFDSEGSQHPGTRDRRHSESWFLLVSHPSTIMVRTILVSHPPANICPIMVSHPPAILGSSSAILGCSTAILGCPAVVGFKPALPKPTSAECSTAAASGMGWHATVNEATLLPHRKEVNLVFFTYLVYSKA